MRARDARDRTHRRGAVTAAWALLAAAFLAFSATAAAAIPGTPDPVAAGVPGYGRAWELVTPADVTPARVSEGLGGSPLIAISTTGDRLAYRTVSVAPEASYGALFATSMAERHGDGWTSTPLEPPYPGSIPYIRVLLGHEGPLQFDSELRTSVWGNGLPGQGESLGLFTREDDGTYQPLGRIGEEGLNGWAEFLGASSDLRRVFFQSDDHLLPGDAARTQGRSIYEFANSELHLVDVEDGGSLMSNCGSNPAYGPARRSQAMGCGLSFAAEPPVANTKVSTCGPAATPRKSPLPSAPFPTPSAAPHGTSTLPARPLTAPLPISQPTSG